MARLRRTPVLLIAAFVLLAPGPLAAQGGTAAWTGQVSVGMAFSESSDQPTAPGAGFAAVARLGPGRSGTLPVIAEVSLRLLSSANVLDRLPGPCPFPQCAPAPSGRRHLVGVGVGLQPHVRIAGGFTLQVSTTVGAYWLYRRSPEAPSAAAGLSTSLGFLLPSSRPVRPMLEATALRLIGPGIAAPLTVHFALGLRLH